MLSTILCLVPWGRGPGGCNSRSWRGSCEPDGDGPETGREGSVLSRLTAFLAEPARVLMSRVGELEPLARVAGPWGKKGI